MKEKELPEEHLQREANSTNVTPESIALRHLLDNYRRNSVAHTVASQNANFRNQLRRLSLPNIFHAPGKA